MAFCYPRPSWTHFEGCLCSGCCMLITFSSEHIHVSHMNPYIFFYLLILFSSDVLFLPLTDISKKVDPDTAARDPRKADNVQYKRKVVFKVGVTKYIIIKYEACLLNLSWSTYLPTSNVKYSIGFRKSQQCVQPLGQLLCQGVEYTHTKTRGQTLSVCLKPLGP